MKFIITKPEYLNVKRAWKAIPTGQQTACSAIIYNALRGFDCNRGFSPVTNPNKLANGYAPMYAYKKSLRLAQYQIRRLDKVFGLTLTDELRKRILSALE